jgi:hypothetical protein
MPTEPTRSLRPAHNADETSSKPSAARPSSGRVGAPAGNQNATKHGVFAHGRGAPACAPGASVDLDAAIADLQRRLRQLSTYIDDNLTDLDADTFVRLANLQGQLTSRLGRLMRDRQQVSGNAGDELTAAINDALDEISEEWGLDL